MSPRSLLLLGSLSFLGCTPSAKPSTPPPSAPSAPDSVEGSDARPQAAASELVLPSRFEWGRIFLDLRTTEGQDLRFLTDTGGGLYVQAEVAQRLGLPIEQAEGDGGQPIEVVALPTLDATTPMPPVAVLDGRFPVTRQTFPDDAFGDGLLGQAWFRDRVWTIDYGSERFVLHPDSVGCTDGTPVPLGFPEQDGQRLTSYPRIQAQIDGQVVDLLFDTGATVMLTEPGLAALADDGPPVRATSFIVRSTFDRWRRDHPTWRVVDNADRLAGDPMIEVPTITVGELSVGPVWFTAREDPNFHEFMSSFMDRRVDGALGGSALQYLQVTVDYPRAEACLRAG